MLSSKTFKIQRSLVNSNSEGLDLEFELSTCSYYSFGWYDRYLYIFNQYVYKTNHNFFLMFSFKLYMWPTSIYVCCRVFAHIKRLIYGLSNLNVVFSDCSYFFRLTRRNGLRLYAMFKKETIRLPTWVCHKVICRLQRPVFTEHRWYVMYCNVIV